MQILLQPFIQLKSASTNSPQDRTQEIAVSSNLLSNNSIIHVFLNIIEGKMQTINQNFDLSQRGVYIVSVSKRKLWIGHKT